MWWSIRCSHKRGHKRGSGKQNLLYSEALEEGGHRRSIMFWLGGRRQEHGKNLRQAFIGVSVGKARQSRINCLGLASFNNSISLWALWASRQVVSSCLLLGHRMIWRRGLSPGVYWPDGEGMTLDWLVCRSKACCQLSPLLSLRTVQPLQEQSLPS